MFCIHVSSPLTEYINVCCRFCLVWVQAAMGGRSKGVYQTVVELVRLYHALSLSIHHQSPLCRLPTNWIGQIWAPWTWATELASVRPHYGIRGFVCYRQCAQLCADHFPLPGWSVLRTSANLTRMYADRYSQVSVHIFPCDYLVCVWFESAVLVLHSDVQWPDNIISFVSKSLHKRLYSKHVQVTVCAKSRSHIWTVFWISRIAPLIIEKLSDKLSEQLDITITCSRTDIAA